MPTVQLPNGQTATFPDGMNPEDIQKAIESDPNSGYKPPSLLQTMKNNFNAAVKGAQPGDSGLKGFVENVGQGGAQALTGLENMIAHPLDEAHREVDAVRAGPHAWLDQAHQEVDAARADPSRFIGNTIGNLGTGYMLGEAGGAALKPIMGKASEAVANIRPKSSPSIVPPIQTAAENLAGSVVPKANDIPGFVDSVTRNAGNINDFAERSNNPLRTQAEFEKAVKGAGDERYQHFMTNILEPNADTPVPVPEGYGGTRSGAGTAKLGDINSRIGRLNNLMNPAYGFANPGDVSTSLAKTPMEALKAEHSALVPLLHDSLSEATGIPSEQIGSLRQSFGSLKNLGDLITEARAGRIGKVGLANESTGGSSIPRPSLIPFADQAVDALRGGRNAIADRSFQKAWGNLKPLIGDAEPLPQSPEGFLEQRAYQTAANQDAARMEAARAHESTNAAQDAAAQRSKRVAGFKDSRDALAKSQRDLEAEAARTVGRKKAMSGGR